MEFVVTHNKSHFVREKLDRINQLFDVDVSFSSPRSSAESTGSQWIHLKGVKENNEKAKEYIMSLCDPDMDIIISFPESVLAVIHHSLNKLEYDSGAVITFVSDREIRIRGSQMACAIASSAIEDLKSRPTMDIDPTLKEFAIKLGYTEQDIQTVVKKHGPMVNENTLLHELIKISRTGQTLAPYTQSTRNPNRHPIAEYEKYPVVPKGMHSPAVPHGIPHRDVVARGAPSSASTNAVRVMRINGDKVSYENVVSPTPCNETSERPTLDKQEEQQVYQQLFEGTDERKNGDTSSELRHIVIDGSNVAMSHGNQETFSCFGIALCVNWFRQRGHKDITVFVPQWRKETPKPDFPMSDQEILLDLEKERIVVFTPSRRINGRRIVCYDDRFIVRLAADQDGIIVSNDNYRDLVSENPKWKEVIEQRLLMFSFVKDTFMVPDDPLGRHGPTLDNFLRKGTVAHPRVCPYLGKCTFGLKCRFYHPERDPARKQESETVTSKTALPKSHESKRKDSLIDRTYRLHDRAMANSQDVRSFKPSGVYDRQHATTYSDYYHQDYAGQSMYPVNGMPHRQMVDPYYVPVRQIQPYPPSQSRVHECLNGNAVNTNRQSQAGNSSSRSDVPDAPWDKKDQDLFQQLKAIYTQPEHEQVIRHVILNGQGKSLETLAADVADRVHGN